MNYGKRVIVRAFHGTKSAEPFPELRLPEWNDREHSIFAAMSPLLAEANASLQNHGGRLERLVAEIDVHIETERLVDLEWCTSGPPPWVDQVLPVTAINTKKIDHWYAQNARRKPAATRTYLLERNVRVLVSNDDIGSRTNPQQLHILDPGSVTIRRWGFFRRYELVDIETHATLLTAADVEKYHRNNRLEWNGVRWDYSSQ